MATFLEESLGYTSYVEDIGWKSMSIKVKDPLYKGLLLNRAYLDVDWFCLVLREDTAEACL